MSSEVLNTCSFVKTTRRQHKPDTWIRVQELEFDHANFELRKGMDGLCHVYYNGDLVLKFVGDRDLATRAFAVICLAFLEGRDHKVKEDDNA